MSIRWMAVQYVGDTLRIPVANESDMDKPFGSSVLERDVRRIVVNPFSDSPQAFVPEAENDKLRELVTDAWGYINHPANATWTHKKRKEVRDNIGDRMRELGVSIDG